MWSSMDQDMPDVLIPLAIIGVIGVGCGISLAFRLYCGRSHVENLVNSNLLSSDHIDVTVYPVN